MYGASWATGDAALGNYSMLHFHEVLKVVTLQRLRRVMVTRGNLDWKATDYLVTDLHFVKRRVLWMGVGGGSTTVGVAASCLATLFLSWPSRSLK